MEPIIRIPLPKKVAERLSVEMAEWEIHALRGLVTVLVVQVQLYAREHPEAAPLAKSLVEFKKNVQDAQLEALIDPVKRRMRPTPEDFGPAEKGSAK